jgi:hypothetical protein
MIPMLLKAMLKNLLMRWPHKSSVFVYGDAKFCI